jgi:putative SOS response-associated peptidase YedK
MAKSHSKALGPPPWPAQCTPCQIAKEWEGTFAVITVPSNDLVGQIHDRMPAILELKSYDAGSV